MQEKLVSLGTISAKIDYGLTASATERDTGNKFLRITDISEGRVNWADVPYCQCSQHDAKKYELQRGDIVFARTGSVGNSCLVREVPKGAVFASYLIRIRPNKQLVDPVYLSYFFHTPDYWQQIMGAAVGAIHLGLNATKLKQLRIPLPPLPGQKRIAAILAKADRLRGLRRTARDLSHTYLQSVFLEMFGDPVTNPMGWEVTTLRKVASINRGQFSPRPRNDPRYYGGSYPFIQTGDIAKSDGFLTEWTQTLNEEGTRVSRAFDVGTVVIAIVGATIGETAILGIRAYCPDSVIGIEVDPNSSSPEYIEHLLRFWKPIFRARAPETARANINLETLRPVPVPLPPLPLQQRFTQVVHKFEWLRVQQREAQRQAEHLFQTLLHRAFRGEV